MGCQKRQERRVFQDTGSVDVFFKDKLSRQHGDLDKCCFSRLVEEE